MFSLILNAHFHLLTLLSYVILMLAPIDIASFEPCLRAARTTLLSRWFEIHPINSDVLLTLQVQIPIQERNEQATA
jgi:hypothetical protein